MIARTCPSSLRRRINAIRYALIIGNSTYKTDMTSPGTCDVKGPIQTSVHLKDRSKLDCDVPIAINDAYAISAALKHWDFDIDLRLNLDETGMRGAIDEFVAEVKKKEEQLRWRKGEAAILFFFSGHGMERNGRNCLVPIDVAPNIDARYSSLIDLDADVIQRLARDVQHGCTFSPVIAIVEACRTDTSLSQSEGGLTQVKPLDNTMIMMGQSATKPVLTPMVSEDAQASPFVAAICAEIWKSNGLATLEEIFLTAIPECERRSREWLGKKHPPAKPAPTVPSACLDPALDTDCRFTHPVHTDAQGISYPVQLPVLSCGLRYGIEISSRGTEFLRHMQHKALVGELSKSAYSGATQNDNYSKHLEQAERLWMETIQNWKDVDDCLHPSEVYKVAGITFEAFRKNGALRGAYRHKYFSTMDGAKRACLALRCSCLLSKYISLVIGDADYRYDIKKALRGDKDAALRIAEMYRDGTNSIPKEHGPQKPAMESWLKYSTQLGSGIASSMLADYYGDIGSTVECAEYRARARELGYVFSPDIPSTPSN